MVILDGVLLAASFVCLFGFVDGYDPYEHTCTPTAKNWGIAAAILFSLSMLFMMLSYLLI